MVVRMILKLILDFEVVEYGEIVEVVEGLSPLEATIIMGFVFFALGLLMYGLLKMMR